MSVADDAPSVAAFGVEDDSSDDGINIMAHDPPTAAVVGTEKLDEIFAEQRVDSFENDTAAVQLTASCLGGAVEAPRDHAEGSSRRKTPEMAIPPDNRSSRAPSGVGSASRVSPDVGEGGAPHHNKTVAFPHDAWQQEQPLSEVGVSGETTEMRKSPHAVEAALDPVTPGDGIGTALSLPPLDVMKSTRSGSITVAQPVEASSTALKQKDGVPMAEAKSKAEANHVDTEHIPSSSLILCRRNNQNRQRASTFDWDTDTCSSSEPTERLEPQDPDSSNIAGGTSQQKDSTESERNTQGVPQMAEIAAVTIPGRRSVVSSKFFKLFSAAQSAELDDGRVYGVKSIDGIVEILTLSSNGVCGHIPPIIAKLGSLKCINLSQNHISGPIPSELGSLLQLRTVQLQGNNLRDEIPPLLGSLINLVRLSLGNNKLSGSLPDSLGNLASLQFLSVEHNRLSGPIPDSICRLHFLETLNVSENKLEGQVPYEIGNLRQLRKLDLGHNLLTGQIPQSICNLQHLAWLHLNDNQLTGPVPGCLANLKNLLIFNLSFNQLSGILPSALGKLSDLVCVTLQGNLFKGPFPFPTSWEVASNVGGMQTLDLGNNDLEEKFPDLTGLLALQTLSLENNQLFGGIRRGLSKACPKLRILNLQNNKLAGELPAELGELTNLEVLNLSGNCFTGSLPPQLESLQVLRTLSASDNDLDGPIPPFLGNLSSLTDLALDGNKLSGHVPPELGMLTNLQRLYLEKNSLVGAIPPELSGCHELHELYLHENQLRGKIPDSLRRLVELRYLYLYQNRLNGPVPEWLGILPRLRGLVLGHNELQGHIPWQLGHLHELHDLYLNDNCLEGSIPEQLRHCDRLQRLNIGGNRLTGKIPRYLRHMPELRELNVEWNALHGEIPIPLFLKTSLGPNASGFKYGGNPRLTDSREHFARTFEGTLCAEFVNTSGEKPSFKKYKPTSCRRGTLPGEKGSDIEASQDGDGAPGRLRDLKLEGRIGGAGGGDHSGGQARGDCGRPWETDEDVVYFLLKTVAGNTIAFVDIFIAVRLFMAGCIWGGVAMILWNEIAAVEGVIATRRLGYGCKWQTLAVLRLAMPMQATVCFHHSCESDLFQALQQVEWCWLAMVQLVTPLASALARWDDGPAGYVMWPFVVVKMLLVGVVYMHRLDDRRMALRLEFLREREKAATPTTRVSTTEWQFRSILYFSDSALPRLIMIGYHIGELGARAFPLSAFVAGLAARGPLLCLLFTLVALLPGMAIRCLVRHKIGMTAPRTRWRAISASAVKGVLYRSLALDSEFGSGTPEHAASAVVTTAEAVTFIALAASLPQTYPAPVAEGLMCMSVIMLIYSWVVLVLEKLLALAIASWYPPPLPEPPPTAPLLAAPLPYRTSGSSLPPLAASSQPSGGSHQVSSSSPLPPSLPFPDMKRPLSWESPIIPMGLGEVDPEDDLGIPGSDTAGAPTGRRSSKGSVLPTEW